MRLVTLAVCAYLGTGLASVNAAEPKTEDEKALYALGAAVGRNVASFNLTPAELQFVQQGFADTAANKEAKLDVQSYFPKIQELQTSRQTAAAAVEKKAGDEFQAKAAAAKGAKKTASGLIYSSIKEGTGPSPKDHRCGQSALSRHVAQRQSVRQLGTAQGAGDLPAQWRDSVLDRRRAADEGGRQEQTGVSVGYRLRRSRCTAGHQAGRDARIRSRAARDRKPEPAAGSR